jgi:hypothetical protein
MGILLGILAGTVRPGSATPIIDQNFSVTPPLEGSVASETGDTSFAQSFTVGIAGLLTGADLLVFDGSSWFGLNPPTVSDIVVQIRTLIAGFPTETMLATGIIPATILPTDPQNRFTHVDFATGVAVVPDEVLALTTTGIANGWWGQVGTQATYAGGQAFVRPHAATPWLPFTMVDPLGRPGDFLFRTYVDPTAIPEPSTFWSLMVVTAVAFVWKRHGQHH